jgi:hypothetical protein
VSFGSSIFNSPSFVIIANTQRPLWTSDPIAIMILPPHIEFDFRSSLAEPEEASPFHNIRLRAVSKSAAFLQERQPRSFWKAKLRATSLTDHNGKALDMPNAFTSDYFFSLATQYYVAARWLTFTVAGTVAGNLFHHAIELYVKGDLSRSVSPDDLKKKYGHKLKPLWKHYKQKRSASASALSGFDNCIKDLDNFETIRYPDAIAEKGMFFAIPISHPQPPLEFSAVGKTPPIYSVAVNDIDRLIRILFTTSSLNPDFFFAKLTMEAKAVLYRDNPAFVAA